MPEIGRKKLDNRAQPYILVGYGSNQYKLADPRTHKTIWVRDAVILEGNYSHGSKPTDDDQLVLEQADNENWTNLYDQTVQPHRTDHPDQYDRTNHPEQPDRTDHPDQHDRTNHPEQPDRTDHPDQYDIIRPDSPEDQERPTNQTSTNNPCSYEEFIQQLQQYS